MKRAIHVVLDFDLLEKSTNDVESSSLSSREQDVRYVFYFSSSCVHSSSSFVM